MVEEVKYSIQVFDNFIKIIPDDGIKNNSTYEIVLKGIKSLDATQELSSTKVKFSTKLSPAYASLSSVQSLIGECHVADEVLLYHIREASKFVNYIKGTTIAEGEDVPFEIEQYVKYKAAHDGLLVFYIKKASVSGEKGSLGDISYEANTKLADIVILFKYLKIEYLRWQENLQDYNFEGRGRAKPLHALKGGNAQSIMTNLNLDFSRGV